MLHRNIQYLRWYCANPQQIETYIQNNDLSCILTGQFLLGFRPLTPQILPLGNLPISLHKQTAASNAERLIKVGGKEGIFSKAEPEQSKRPVNTWPLCAAFCLNKMPLRVADIQGETTS
jgi:hypothetical protein